MADVDMTDARGPNRRQRKPYDRPTERSEAPDGQWLHDRAPRGKVGNSNSDSKGSANDDKWQHDRAPGGSRGRGGDRDRDRESNEPSQKLLVSGLHYEVSERDLNNAFSGYGSFTRDPIIRYDRSGRSTGVGVVIFTTADQAAHAKRQMQGVVLKGEAIDIKFDRFTIRPDKSGNISSPDPNSLLNRIGKPSLKDRITDAEASDVKMDDSRSGPGPIRTPRGSGGPPRGGGGPPRESGGGGPPRGSGGGSGGRGAGPSRGRGRGAPGGAGRGERERKPRDGPKTAEQLDAELEKYSKTGVSDANPAPAGDVEMAT